MTEFFLYHSVKLYAILLELQRYVNPRVVVAYTCPKRNVSGLQWHLLRLSLGGTRASSTNTVTYEKSAVSLLQSGQ